MNRAIALGTIALLVVVAGCSKKQPEQTPTGDVTPPPATSHQGDAVTEHGTAGESITPANTAAGIWQQIDEERSELGKVVAAGSLEQVHQRAFAIRDLVAALPGVSQSLPAGAQSQLASGAKSVADEAEALDTAGDAGDLDATQKGLAALDATLTELRSLTGGGK